MSYATLPEIPPLDLIEMYGWMGVYRVLEPDTEILMRERAEREHRGQDIARGEHWHTSFHASEFPGDDPDACPRFLAYRMMDFPPDKAMPPWVTTTGDVGKAGELTIARAWYEGGRSLALPDDAHDEAQQIVFEHRGVWMSASTDLPVLKPFWTKPHITEIKGKADEVVEEMIKGRWDERQRCFIPRRWDEAHRRQVLASLGLAHEFDWGFATVCRHTWRILHSTTLEAQGVPMQQCPEHGLTCAYTFKLEPPDTCSIYYWSRSWPRKTVEFYFRHQPDFMDAGFDVLDQARAHFEADQIPPRPDWWNGWSMGPCKNCTQKKYACRDDFGRRKTDKPVTVLSQSNGVKWARTLRGDSYDPQVVRERVQKRWRPDAQRS